MNRFISIWTCIIAASPLVAQSALGQEFVHRVIAATGDLADPRDGETFKTLRTPVISHDGDVAFRATLNGPSGSPSLGLWRTVNGELVNVVRGTYPVDAALGGGTWEDGIDPIFLADDSLGFFGFRRIGTTSVKGLYQVDSSLQTWTGFIDDGPFEPDVPGGVEFPGSGRPVALSSNGFAGVFVGLQGSDSEDAGIWAGVPGAMFPAARARVPLGDGRPAFEAQHLYRPRVNSLGQTLFVARSDVNVYVGGVPYKDEALWLHDGSSVVQLLRTGQQAPGMPTGTLISNGFYYNEKYMIDDSGRIAAIGTFRLRPYTIYSEGDALWVGLPGSLALVAYRGLPAPGLPAGVVFGGFHSPPLFAADGHVVLQVILDGTVHAYDGRRGLWVRDPSVGWRNILLQDTPSSVLPADHWFRNTAANAVNSRGEVMIQSQFSLFTSSLMQDGLFLYNSDGLQRVLLTGDAIEISPGISKIVRDIAMEDPGSNEGGMCTSINNDGQMTYLVTFTDATQAIVVSAKLPPPCPGDVNGDRTVDVQDFLDYIDSFGQCLSSPGPCIPPGSVVDGDFNGDTIVDVGDFLDFFDAFGAMSGACPE
jgi:hypothetical protein